MYTSTQTPVTPVLPGVLSTSHHNVHVHINPDISHSCFVWGVVNVSPQRTCTHQPRHQSLLFCLGCCQRLTTTYMYTSTQTPVTPVLSGVMSTSHHNVHVHINPDTSHSCFVWGDVNVSPQRTCTHQARHQSLLFCLG